MDAEVLGKYLISTFESQVAEVEKATHSGTMWMR
jgi:hypothetical protein